MEPATFGQFKILHSQMSAVKVFDANYSVLFAPTKD